MANNLWIIVGFGPVLCVGPPSPSRNAAARGGLRLGQHSLGLTATARWSPRGRRRRASTGHAASSNAGYRRAPYNFVSSRIRDDAEFEHCLDLATMLGLRIGELSGASIATPRERERTVIRSCRAYHRGQLPRPH